jgi:hypothetical protein
MKSRNNNFCQKIVIFNLNWSIVLFMVMIVTVIWNLCIILRTIKTTFGIVVMRFTLMKLVT